MQNYLKFNKVPLGVRAAIVYTFANVFSKGLAIITMPIFTRLMSTDQIGEVNLYNSWFAMLSSIATLSLTSGGFSVAMKEYEGNRREYTSSILTLTSFIAMLFMITYFINMDFWDSIIGLKRNLVVLIIIGLFFSPATDFWLLYERYEYHYKNSAMLTMGSAFLSSMMSIITIIVMNNHGRTNLAEGRLISNAIIVYGVAVGLWFILMIKGKTFVNIKYWKFSLSLSLPLVGYSIASQILSVSDRMMIGRMVNNSAVGIYSTVYSVGTLFTLVWAAINTSFVPYLYQNIGRNNDKIKKTSFVLLLLYSGVAVVAVLFAPEILKILATDEYLEGVYLMPPVAIGIFMTAVANMYSNILLYLKKSKQIMISACVAAIFNVASNYFLIPIMGYKVAAYTTMFAYIFMMLLLMVSANFQFKKQELKALNTIYDNSIIIMLCLVMIFILMFGIVLYKFTILRYVIALLGILIVVKLGLGLLKRL